MGAGLINPQQSVPGFTQLSPEQEKAFRQWFAQQAAATGMNPNPSSFLHQYDNRAAFLANAQPNAEMHWPSQFKMAGHPNRFIQEPGLGLLDTQSGLVLGNLRKRMVGQ